MKSIYFYQPVIEDQRIMHLAESMEIIEKNSHWVQGSMPLFSLLDEKRPNIVFLNGTENPEHVKYAKNDFPTTKFVLVTNQSNVQHDVYDLVVNLSDKDAPGMYLDYLVNQWHCGGKADEVYETDILYITDSHDMSNEFKTKMINSIGNKYRLKAYGSKRLQSLYYLGNVHRLEYKNLIASAKIVLMFDKEWLNTTITNGKIPVIYNNSVTSEFEFSNYQELDAACSNLLDKKAEKATFETYTDFCVKLIEEVYK